ncbi:MAG TPA: tetratricopeptide repeat protein [Candidatus Limnocylindrales bacterium]|nr:tetratricopeptide repeat protein [Candidatus Limnocylindrales bacterium]
MTRALPWVAGVAMAALVALPAAGAKPKKTNAPPLPPPSREVAPQYPPALPPLSRDERLPEGYQEMVRRLMQRSPADSLGDGLYAVADASFHAGSFDEATKLYATFAQLYTRNLRLNEALERVLMIRDCRDFDDEPLRIYAHAEELRREGKADSAAAALSAGLSRYPGARLRWHYRYALAEIARDKGNHALAVEQALAVADTSTGSRLAPYALKLAGDETLAAGGPPERAAGYYQALLERYPDSPLAAPVRVQVLALRKRMQL